MLFAALLLLFPLPQVRDTPKVISDSPVISSLSSTLPSVPQPKIKVDPAPSTWLIVPAEAIMPGSTPALRGPLKFAISGTYETPQQRKTWYALVAAGHSAAAFDAWSTRRAISGGYGTESNPMLRPFANSNALYAATQVSPTVMDFIGRRMMVSRNPLVRKMWWVPQAAGAGFSVMAGVHNVRLVP